MGESSAAVGYLYFGGHNQSLSFHIWHQMTYFGNHWVNHRAIEGPAHVVGGDPRVAGSLNVECYGSFDRTRVEGRASFEPPKSAD